MSDSDQENGNVGFKDVVKTLVLTVVLGVGAYYLSTPIFKLMGFGPTALEKSLVIGKSTKNDFQNFKDEGGLSKDNVWLHGFQVTNVSANYGKNDFLRGYELHFSKGFSTTVPSVNEIKKVFKGVCGSKWDVYLAKSENGIMCLISDGAEQTSIRVQKLD